MVLGSPKRSGSGRKSVESGRGKMDKIRGIISASHKVYLVPRSSWAGGTEGGSKMKSGDKNICT